MAFPLEIYNKIYTPKLEVVGQISKWVGIKMTSGKPLFRALHNIIRTTTHTHIHTLHYIGSDLTDKEKPLGSDVLSRSR